MVMTRAKTKQEKNPQYWNDLFVTNFINGVEHRAKIEFYKSKLGSSELQDYVKQQLQLNLKNQELCDYIMGDCCSMYYKLTGKNLLSRHDYILNLL